MLKKFTGTYLIAILIMLCTYVPFNLVESTSKNSILVFQRHLGHASLWYDLIQGNLKAVIDSKQLIIQILIITMIFAIVYLFLPNKKSKSIPN